LRPRARTRGRGKKFVTPEIMVSERPAEAEDRAVPGHWEGDLILGLDSSAIGTLVERTTRFTMLLHLPRMDGHGDGPPIKNGPALAGHGAEAVRDAIAASIVTLPEHLRRSLTWDQGAEMAQHAKLRIHTGLDIYFCEFEILTRRCPDRLISIFTQPLPNHIGVRERHVASPEKLPARAAGCVAAMRVWLLRSTARNQHPWSHWWWSSSRHRPRSSRQTSRCQRRRRSPWQL
jgi:hypothetical protein